MARKNNPKQTIENIITVSGKLFMEKGFEKTCMQDIVDALGMSKGAIFHHFKSKEEIFTAVMEKQHDYVAEVVYPQWFSEVEGLSGKDKLKYLIKKNMADKSSLEISRAAASAMDSPHIIKAMMSNGIKKSAPLIAEIIREGIEDGSITTEYPDEYAQVFILLINIWCDPVIFECNTAALFKRLKFLQHLSRQLGVDIITDEVIESIMGYTENIYKE
jgi:AcrR family transcriptional regulator